MDNNNSSNVILFRQRKSPEMPAARQGISHLHLTALNSLTAYTAYSLKIDCSTIQAMVLTAFGIRSYEQLEEEDFNRAVQYIIALHDEHIVIH